MQQQCRQYFALMPPPPGPWGQNVKIYLFPNMVMLHIKLNRITNAETWLQIFYLQAPPIATRPWGWGQNVKT